MGHLGEAGVGSKEQRVKTDTLSPWILLTLKGSPPTPQVNYPIALEFDPRANVSWLIFST